MKVEVEKRSKLRLAGVRLPRSGEKPGERVSYEMSRNTPMTDQPNELVTDVYVPLK
jgi:DNA gyrase inhibitor GyrI